MFKVLIGVWLPFLVLIIVKRNNSVNSKSTFFICTYDLCNQSWAECEVKTGETIFSIFFLQTAMTVKFLPFVAVYVR